MTPLQTPDFFHDLPKDCRACVVVIAVRGYDEEMKARTATNGWGAQQHVFATEEDGSRWIMIDQPRSHMPHFITIEAAVEACRIWSVNSMAPVEGMVPFFDPKSPGLGQYVLQNPEWDKAEAFVATVLKVDPPKKEDGLPPFPKYQRTEGSLILTRPLTRRELMDDMQAHPEKYLGMVDKTMHLSGGNRHGRFAKLMTMPEGAGYSYTAEVHKPCVPGPEIKFQP